MANFQIKDLPKDLLDWIFKTCEENGDKIEIRPVSYLKNGGACGGYYEGNKIVVAGKNKKSGEVLLHEVAHGYQRAEKHPLWTDKRHWEGDFGIEHFHKFYELILLERDCELRVVEIAKKWNLFDIADYNRRCNSYLYLHHYFFLRRGWVNFKGFKSKLILDRMPSEIVSEKDLLSIDMELMSLFDKVQKGRPIK